MHAEVITRLRPWLRDQQAIERLFDVRLVDSLTPDRYTMHDLIRLYAKGRAEDTDPEERRVAALRRVLGLYIATTSAALRLLYPHRVHATGARDR
ncbi:hypothetical protein AB0O34_25120 [Sphaerisporangium sp. NPDC088356]|uniref:hypothetical protein n=1 Tax=Sphaerisporangium sp. NPDC088356 TaxID=3154871 RepID=UPI003425505F